MKVVIYSLQSHQDNVRTWLGQHSPVISAITQLEVLGYHNILQKEIDFAVRYFSNCEIIAIDQIVIQNAIEFRQNKKMSIGDAIIAATAKLHELPLATANIKDFEHVKTIELINPL